MANFDYDYFVIGGGSGGVRSARIAAQHGARVGLAESSHLGGTCVNLGCVPKKLFAYGADFGPAFEDAKGFGWSADNVRFDWTTLRDSKTKEIERLNGIYKSLLDNAGVELINGFATFVDDHTLDIDGKKVTADKILIATGGYPRKPTFPGAEHCIVSDDAFYLDELPKRVLIQGGGYVSVEFAHIFHGLGVHVDLIYRDKLFLRGFDTDIRQFLADEMNKQGCTTHFQCDIEKVEKDGDHFKVTCTEGKIIETDLVFSAIGREVNTKNLNLEAAGVKAKDNGVIPVDHAYRTNVPDIYAIGDISSKYALTPVAIAEGHALADNLFGGMDRLVNYENVATAVFSQPPIGTVGLTEEDARQNGYDIQIFKTSFRPMKHTLSGRDEKTLMKMVVDKKSDRVLGLHMCGTDAPEIIQMAAVALQAGATKQTFDDTMAVHPTAAEEFVTMR